MSKQERSVPSYVEYPYEQAILYVHRNASAMRCSNPYRSA